MLRSCQRIRPLPWKIKTHSSPLLSSYVWLNIPSCSRQKNKKKTKSSFQAFFTRFRMRMLIASSGLLSAILRSDRPGVSGSPTALMWRMLSCHLSAFKAFWRRGPRGPSHALCVRQSGGSPPPPPPPPQRSTLYIIFQHLKYRIFFPIIFFFCDFKQNNWFILVRHY